jgi:hypothetical protein
MSLPGSDDTFSPIRSDFPSGIPGVWGMAGGWLGGGQGITASGPFPPLHEGNKQTTVVVISAFSTSHFTLSCAVGKRQERTILLTPTRENM